MIARSFLLALAVFAVIAPASAEPGDRWRDAAHGERPVRHWAGPPPAEGAAGRREGAERRADEAHDLVKAGRLRPLAQVIGELQGRFGGRLLSQDLVNDAGRNIYRIRWITSDGTRIDLSVPADRFGEE